MLFRLKYEKRRYAAADPRVFGLQILATMLLMYTVGLVGAKDLRVLRLKVYWAQAGVEGGGDGFSLERRVSCFGKWYRGSIFAKHI
ncbi:hypothetical protein [Thermofilum sp.]|uniref:hypothetical protein n=1 Tax=Thermofilum sp. TaxID=1961369 RepID=UPI00315FD2EB